MKENNGVMYYLRITLVLLLICGIIAGMLAAVNLLTKDRIAENKVKEMNQKVATIFGEGVTRTELEHTPRKEVDYVWQVSREGEDLGYCVYITVRGYAGDIEMMVGMKPNGEIFGIEIVSMRETAGLGTRIGEDKFLSQYNGKSGKVTENDVDVISGSTVSSKAVIEGVNIATDVYEEVKG